MDTSGATGATLLAGTVSVAALHALIPSHWLSFALVGRARRWPKPRTLKIAALAGTGHLVMTILLGLVLSVAGKALIWQHLPHSLEHGATALLLIALGIYFAVPTLRGHKGCSHPSHRHENDLLEAGKAPLQTQGRGAEPTVIGALVMGLTLSPCLDLLSVYVAASALSWGLLLVLSAVMAVTTLSIMLALIWLAMHGLERVRFKWLEQNEGLVVGITLAALGGILFFLP